MTHKIPVRRQRFKKDRVKYVLRGTIGYWVTPNDANDYVNGRELKTVIFAPDDGSAIDKAKETVKNFVEENKQFSPTVLLRGKIDPCFSFSLEKVVWEMEYRAEKPAERAVRPKKAVPAHIVESK